MENETNDWYPLQKYAELEIEENKEKYRMEKGRVFPKQDR